MDRVEVVVGVVGQRRGRAAFSRLTSANCCMSVCICVSTKKGRSHTTATGTAAVGSLRVLMSWPDTTGSTRATGHSSVRNVTGPFPGQTTSLCTWRDIYETKPWNEGHVWKKKKKKMKTETERRKKTNLKLPSSCRATRQAVVFTAKKRNKMKKQSISYPLKSLSVPLEADPVFAHCTGDSTRPLSQGCKLLLKGTKLEFVLFNWQNLEDQVPAAFFLFFFVSLNWKCIFCQGNQEQQTKWPWKPSPSKTCQHTVKKKTNCINR